MGNKNIDLSDGRNFWLCTQTGVVIQEKEWTETSVHSGPSYGSGSSTVYSTSSDKQKFWIRWTDGKESAFSASDLNLDVRPGHIVTVVWGAFKPNTSGPYFYYINNTTGQKRRANLGKQATQNLGIDPRTPKQARNQDLIACALLLSVYGAPFALAWHFYRKHKYAKYAQEWAETTDHLINSMLPEIKNEVAAIVAERDKGKAAA